MFEGTKAVIRCRNSKKERKYNGKKTNDKKINNIQGRIQDFKLGGGRT
jgi:hypothetical protein